MKALIIFCRYIALFMAGFSAGLIGRYESDFCYIIGIIFAVVIFISSFFVKAE